MGVAWMFHSRRDSSGNYVPLSEQNSAGWNLPLINEAEQLLAAASKMGRPGRFQWLAAVQSAHAQRAFGRAVDWPAILVLYDALLANGFTVGIFIGRVAALAETQGAAVAFEVLEQSTTETRAYQPYWVLRAHLLRRLSRHVDADEAIARALGLTHEPAVHAFLTRERLRKHP